MSETNLNDLSKVYQDQIAEKKKDDTYLEPDMKKRQANNEKARKDLMKGPQMKNPHFEEKKLDPVGQEDADIDNDGDVDSSDKYLKKRRKAIGKAIKKESFTKSDWRDSLSEVINDIESKPIKEKKVNNKVKINPTMGEAVEEMGGTLLEEIEVDEFEGIVEGVYDELIEEGYSEDDVEAALEQALNEATVSFGHDTKELKKDGSQVGSRRRQLKRRAGEFLQKTKKKVGMASAKAQVAAYNKSREVAQTAGDKVRRAKKAVSDAPKKAKSSVKGGIRKLAQKVVDRMSEEVVGEAYTVTAADKKGNTKAYQNYKAGMKGKDGKPLYKRVAHFGLGDGDPCWDTHKQVGMKKKGNRMVPNCVPKNEEVEVSEEGSMSAQEIALQKRKATIDQMIARKRKQSLDKGQSEQPAKAMGEAKELSVDDQMRISRDHNRKSPEEKKAANSKLLGAIKKVKREKDTRTDAQKMTDATGPRPGSRYRGD